MRSALVAWLALAGCGRGPAPAEIEIHGSLRGVMHDGQTAGVARLADVAHAGTWGIATLAELAGEAIIVDGRVIRSYPDGRLVEGADDAEAALLVTLSPRTWTTIQIDGRLDSLEAGLDEIVRERSLAPPFLFVLEGQAQVRYHVIDGTKLAPGASREEHMKSGIQAAYEGAVTIVGFYSTTHEGVITHMGEHVHAHVVAPLERPVASGHVDSAIVQPGATLRVGR